MMPAPRPIPPFPLRAVLIDPACALLTPPAIGHLLLLLDALWSNGSMALPDKQAVVQGVCRAGDMVWRRNGPKVLAAYAALQPALAAALARALRVQAGQARGAAAARAGRAVRQAQIHKDILMSSQDPAQSIHVRPKRLPRGVEDVGGSGLAVPHGPSLTRAQVAEQQQTPKSLRD